MWFGAGVCAHAQAACWSSVLLLAVVLVLVLVSLLAVALVLMPVLAAFFPVRCRALVTLALMLLLTHLPSRSNADAGAGVDSNA